MLWVTIIGVLAGWLTAAVVRRTADLVAVRQTRRTIHACLLEFRLFFDEPQVVWQAHVRLMRENARLLRLLLLPAMLLLLPMTWLMLQLEAVFGVRPLRVAESAVVTAQLSRALSDGDRFALEGKDGLIVETGPVRIPSENQVSWRVRAGTGTSGSVVVQLNGRGVTKTVAVGDRRAWLSRQRSQSWTEFVAHPQESRIQGGEVEWVEVEYPAESGSWVWWFLAVSGAAALVSGRW